MATDTLRGDGLVRAQRALAALEENPQRLDRARMRFSDSPPPYTSRQSHNSTRFQSPNPPSEEQRRPEEPRWQLKAERRASLPYYQLQAQESEEEERLLEAHRNGTPRLLVGSNFKKLARENVKKRWVEQGIWNDKWTDTASTGVWKHEQPLEPEPELEAETNDQPSLFSFSQPKPRRPKSDEENRQMAEQRATREREREASRPFHQFFYQVLKESERIKDELGSRETGAAPADINTRAYENIKNTWIKRKIWNSKWVILPGMSWRHEDPLEEELADGPVPIQADTLRNANNGGAVETPQARIFGSSVPAETNCHQGQSANTESAGLANGDVEHSTLELNSASQPAVRTARASRRRPPSHAPARGGPGARRRPNATAPRPGTAEPLLQTASRPAVPASMPRRSARIADLPQRQGVSEREPKPKVMPKPKRKRGGTASDEVKEPQMSKRRKLVQEI